MGEEQITQLLQAWSAGDESALKELVPVVRAVLHRQAKHYMAKENTGHVLQTTALVNEAYVRLIDWKKASWKDRAHFFSVSARLMRNILVDTARRSPHPEGGLRTGQVSLDEAMVVSRDKTRELVAIHDSLTALEGLDPRKSQIVELRFFGGLTVEETAEVLKISRRTVIREWNKAKVWLHRELSKEECNGA